MGQAGYVQQYAPVLGSLAWSSLVAALPLLVLFVLLGGLRVRAWLASLISLVVALALVSQGVIQNLRPYDTARLMEAQKVTGTDGKVGALSNRIDRLDDHIGDTDDRIGLINERIAAVDEHEFPPENPLAIWP